MNIIAAPFQQTQGELPSPRPRQSNPKCASITGLVPPAIPVLKDGAVYRATTVWAQDNVVCFATPDGTGGQVSVASVNREDTQRATRRSTSRSRCPRG